LSGSDAKGASSENNLRREARGDGFGRTMSPNGRTHYNLKNSKGTGALFAEGPFQAVGDENGKLILNTMPHGSRRKASMVPP
jgi:hypothetical protein